MKKLVLPLLLLTLPIPTPVLAKAPIRTIENCTVAKVVDGDTITAICDGSKLRVRLYGIDAPEIEKRSKKTGKLTKAGQPFGEESQKALESKIGGQKIELKVMSIDRYRRLVSLISLSGTNINKEMVADGWAWAYRQYLNRPYKSEFIRAEDEAREARRGIWQQVNPQPPWEFRRLCR